MNKKNLKGFTLIEVMIVVAILGIISAIAVPSYVEYVKKGKRADAKVELLRLAQMQESYFVQNLSYADSLATLGLSGTVTSEQDEYTMSISDKTTDCDGTTAAPCTAYTLTATPVTGKSQANDASCLGFTLNNVGRKGITVTDATDAAIKKCWK